MGIVRGLVLLCLLAAAACFVLYAFTGELRYRRWGARIFIGTLIAAFVFFAVLIAERLA